VPPKKRESDRERGREREREREERLLYSMRIRFHVCVHKSISFPPLEINNIIKPPSRKLLLKTVIKLITIVVLCIQNV